MAAPSGLGRAPASEGREQLLLSPKLDIQRFARLAIDQRKLKIAGIFDRLLVEAGEDVARLDARQGRGEPGVTPRTTQGGGS